MKSLSKAEANRARLFERLNASLDHGDRQRGGMLLGRIEALRDGPDVALARWQLAVLGNEIQVALSRLREDLERFPEDSDLHHAVGWSLVELGRETDAIPYLEEACYLDADFADAWYDLALVREATGDSAGMRQAFEAVYAIDTSPDQQPMRFRPDQVMSWAERALHSLPDAVQSVIPELPIFVQDYPDAWILEAAPWDPRLLGLFEGPTLAELRGSEGGGASPHVYLYQRNLERVCHDSRHMAEQVRVTLHHEVGHFLGLEEDDLHDRGLG